MKKFVIFAVIVVGLVFAAKFFVFRGGPPPGMGREMPPPVVETAKITEIEIKDKIETTGLVESPANVDITARVEGYLQKSYFKEGSFVKKGDLLFLIEPDKYKIILQQASADLKETEAAVYEAEKNLVRVKELVEKDYASKAQYDDILAKRDRAKALLDVKQANLEHAKLNLNYTKIYAPISGKIGKIRIDEGNLVTPLSGPIAKIVSLNPIYVNYNITSEDFLKLNRTTKKGEVEITLPDGAVYSEKGQVVFYDNQVDSTTGTLDVRAEFKNPESTLIPGQYVKVLMHVGDAQKCIVAPQEAVLNNAQGNYVYVLQEDNSVKIRPVKVERQYKELWTVKTGLEQGETVVVKGTQKLRPDMKVQENAKK